uniref:Uncharacterized protein n=1 Tax=Pelagomonas calceolata TaxID=35677 RepID=A0A7S3ZST6_9STRA
MGRNRKCDTGHDVSWRWAWKPVGKKRPMKLKSGDGLCDALRGVRVINIGDSLTHQLVETWRARRIASSWPVPDGYAYKKSEEGHLSKEIDLANEFARQTRGGRRRRRLGPHKEAREAAEREARQRSDADEQCANGATFQFIEPQRPWSLVPWAFQEHDPSVAKCGVAFRNQTRDFATHKASELSVWRAVFGKGAIEKDKKKREKRKQRHKAERTRMAVVYNCFAHLESIALEVMNCYAEEAPDRFPTRAAAHKLALADVVAWWRFELAAMARALRTSADRARDELGIELRSFYRTSPPAADRWVHRARYEVKRGDKAKQALAPALKFKAVDEKAFDKLARNVERLAAGSVATTEWARAEGGGAAAPLAVVAELASPPAGEDEYGHEVVDVANGAAAAAFLAAGHGVIDVAAMLGLRVDAHPGSTAGGTDGLHFCMPGPLDYALDLVLARVGSAFDSVVPEIDAPH